MKKLIRASSSAKSRKSIEAAGMAGRGGTFFNLNMLMESYMDKLQFLTYEFNQGKFNEDDAKTVRNSISRSFDELRDYF